MKRIIISFILLFSLFAITACSFNNDKDDKLSIVATNFPCYDFARAITNGSDSVDVIMLLKAGSEIHDFEPTPQDIKMIKQSDMFIYIGGESDSWVDSVLNEVDLSKTKVIRLMDYVDTLTEEVVEGMEADDEKDIDEHIWTSPVNVINIINKLEIDISNIDSANTKIYKSNSDAYIQRLMDIDQQIRDIVNNSKRKELIFGDRFPFRYFTNEYGIKYYAAFPGCAEASEASAKTVSFLINKVKKDKIPVVLKLELSSGKIADNIAKETNTKVMMLHSAHNVSAEDFKKGVTYVDIMKDNIEVLKEALN